MQLLLFNTPWYSFSFPIYVVMIFLTFSSFSNNTHITPNSIDDYLYNYSSRSISKRPHTGVLYNIDVPPSLYGMKVSVLRLRSSALWDKGVNFTHFHIPPRITTIPSVKRLFFIYENNLSSNFYDLPGYTFVTAFVGVAIYDASSSSTNMSPKRVNISVTGNPIRVSFSDGVQVPKGTTMKHVKCARFDPVKGIIELSNMVKSEVCLSHALGHFAIAIPKVYGPMRAHSAHTPLPSSSSRDRNGWKIGSWKWWLVGLGVVILMVSPVVLLCKLIGSRKFRKMERNADKNVALDTRWIGISKMPSASMTRTQPNIFEVDQN